ncbi:MAG: ComEC/Rec2 family competence protein [Verrucomicrobiota bacterium]
MPCFPRPAALLLLLVMARLLADREPTLDIYWIDSLGGGSTLLVTPAGESILIDAGNPGGRDSGRIQEVATRVAGLRQIDHLIVTHLHTDHYGGAAELAALLPIRQVHDNGIPDQDPDGRRDPSWPQRIRPYREMPVAGRNVVQAGGRLDLRQRPGSPPVGLRFVAARQQLALNTNLLANARGCDNLARRAPDTSDNANSIVSLVQFGDFRFFDGGDLTWNVEATLVCPLDQTGPVDVYQVNHHGLEVSNHPRLLQALSPTVAVFNNGPRKGGHPEVVRTLHQLQPRPAIYQVHRNLAAPQANADPAHLANDGEPGGQWMRLTVAPDAREYTVTVPRTGHRQTFPTRK